MYTLYWSTTLAVGCCGRDGVLRSVRHAPPLCRLPPGPNNDSRASLRILARWLFASTHAAMPPASLSYLLTHLLIAAAQFPTVSVSVNEDVVTRPMTCCTDQIRNARSRLLRLSTLISSASNNLRGDFHTSRCVCIQASVYENKAKWNVIASKCVHVYNIFTSFNIIVYTMEQPAWIIW